MAIDAALHGRVFGDEGHRDGDGRVHTGNAFINAGFERQFFR
jgi:hypothetical protein